MKNFYAFKHKTEDRLLAKMDDDSIGLVRPGLDGNYYKNIIFLTTDRNEYNMSPEDCLTLLSKLVTSDEFPFNYEDITIVEFALNV